MKEASKTLLILGWNLFITFPSFVWHGIKNIYNRYKTIKEKSDYSNLIDKDIVVLVHGFGGHYSNFNELKRNLERKENLGNHHILALDLGNTKESSIDNETLRLQIFLEPLDKCRITLIGLSKGGLVIMRYITTVNDERINKVITISSPLKGTKIANLLNSQSIIYKELGYKSKITTEMERIVNENRDILPSIYHIVPKWDHMIIPIKSTYYETTPDDNIYHYNGRFNHVGIPHSVDISNIISYWITS